MADCTEIKEDKNGPRPPIIMKFDEPEESSENSTNDEVEGQSGEENSQTSPLPSAESANKIHSPVLTASKFGNSFGISEFNVPATFGVLKPTLLRPSQLTSEQPASKDNGTEAEKSDDKDKKINNNKNDENKSRTLSAPKFLPLGASPKEHENSLNSSVATSSSPSFVFGQNLKQRVTVGKDDESASHNNDDNDDDDKTSQVETSNENGASELLFSSAATVCRSSSRPGLTLSQAAQEMEEANRANKRKYSQVTPLTGEEGETNVLQINCKLFAFDKETSGWKERGRGTIRLNDCDEESRLVGRAIGTQRLILNTKVWPGMTAELAGPKSLRLTAMDVHGDIRIFIVQAAPKEVDQLHDLLMQRLKRAKERQPKKLATDQ